MGNPVDRTGTFRFDRVNSVGLSAGKSVSEDDPQPRSITFSALLHLSEIWDAETSEWVDWADADAEIVAFLPLYFFDKKTQEQAEFSIRKKVVEVFEWDGASFKTLCEGDYSAVKGQVRLEDDTYDKAKFPFKVAWLDTFDATPGRQLLQITGDDLKNLDKLMARHLQKSAKPTKAASAKGKGKGKGAKALTGDPVSSSPAGAAAPKTSGRPTVPKTTAPVGMGKCSADDAYNACFELKRDDVTEDDLNERWQNIVATYGPDEAKITEEQWFKIKTTLLAAVSKV
ncbi:MAG: hypothetical protein GY938_30645 [Ketobacter sp.]|nr:hypothetical protein [Ketobacter sp.]